MDSNDDGVQLIKGSRLPDDEEDDGNEISEFSSSPEKKTKNKEGKKDKTVKRNKKELEVYYGDKFMKMVGLVYNSINIIVDVIMFIIT